MATALKQALVGAVVSALLFALYLLLFPGNSLFLVIGAACIGFLAVLVAGLLPNQNTARPVVQQLSAPDPSPTITPVKQSRHPIAKQTKSTDRLRRLSHDLERLKESYRHLYHNAPVLYFSLDVHGRLVTFNETLVRTLGYGRDELAGRSYADLLAPSARADWDRHFHLTAKGTNHAAVLKDEVETLWQTKEGIILDIWIRSVPVLDEHGKFVRFRSAALDLTERNRLAHELRTRGDELERTNARLRNINAELEDFTHVVSHDLKEPLRTLQAFSNILAEDFSGQLGPDGFQYINHLVEASRRLGHLIDDLLTLCQAGRIKGSLQDFNLIGSVATMRNDLVGLIQSKQAEVLTEGSLPTVRGDPFRITQLLTNLVANGLKYNNNEVPTVVIGQMRDQELPDNIPDEIDPSHAIVYVRDNGIGIDPRHHHKIFGIFSRLHPPEEYEGTGAGLAICKKIVQAHGGRLWVDSALGQGATFYFTLPRAFQPHNEESMRNGAAPPKTITVQTRDTVLNIEDEDAPAPEQTFPEGSPAHKLSVLLVEDLVDIALIIQSLGAKSGLNVTHFTNAEDAWDYLQNNQPNLLLLDINLPGMSGIDLCKKVRRELKRTAVPIVLFSQEENPDEIDKLHAIGADFILSKDLLIDPVLWDKKITEILRHEPVARERRR